MGPWEDRAEVGPKVDGFQTELRTPDFRPSGGGE